MISLKNFLFLVVIVLAGCATKPIKTDPQLVDVAVAVVTAPPVLLRPDLPIDHVTASSDGADLVRSYAATVLTLEQYSSQLEQIISQYATQAKTTQRIPK